jgi:hypothetical protein
MENNTLITTIMTAISVLGGLTTLYGVLISRKKIDAEAIKLKAEGEKIQNEGYLMLIAPLKDKINDLETRVEELECELTDALNYTNILTAQLYQNKIVPEPRPLSLKTNEDNKPRRKKK